MVGHIVKQYPAAEGKPRRPQGDIRTGSQTTEAGRGLLQARRGEVQTVFAKASPCRPLCPDT